MSRTFTNIGCADAKKVYRVYFIEQQITCVTNLTYANRKKNLELLSFSLKSVNTHPIGLGTLNQRHTQKVGALC